MKSSLALISAIALAACSSRDETVAVVDNGTAETPAAPAAATPAALPANIASAAEPAAGAKVARCEITHATYSENGETRTEGAYTGPCIFTVERGGHFTVTRKGDAPFWEGEKITKISVGIEGNTAEVVGMTPEAISRWGYATRVASDRACWAGDDFKVCAR